MDEPEDDDKTPPRVRRSRSHWGDKERVEVGQRHRTSPVGVPIAPSSEFTPVTEILDLIEDPHLRRVFRLLWEHTANQEMRYRERIDDTDAAALRSDFDQHQDDCLRFKTDLVGLNGEDGRLGEIRKSHHGLIKWLRVIGGAALGAVVTAVVYVAVIARSYGDLEAKVNALQDRVQLVEGALFIRNRLAPAFTPEKETRP